MRRVRTLLLAASAGLALSACASVRPADVRLPAAFEAPGNPAAAPRPAGAIELDRWWLSYNDPALTGLIEQALKSNPDARTALARLKEAQATRASVLLQTLPTSQTSASRRETHTRQLAGTRINIPGFSTNGESVTESGSFNVSWDVDIFGRTLAAARAVGGDAAAAQFDYEATRASLAAQVADAYFQARVAS